MNRHAMERHPLDLVSLLGGLLFMGLGAAFLFDALNWWSADVTWVPPIVLIVLGLAGVLSTVGRQRPVEPVAALDTTSGDPLDATPGPAFEPANATTTSIDANAPEDPT